VKQKIKDVVQLMIDDILCEGDRDLDEFSAVGGGGVVGYTLPLGMSPDYKKMGTDNKKKSKKKSRWYSVYESKDHVFGKNKNNFYRKELDEELIGKKGGVSYYQMGASLPDEPVTLGFLV